MNMRPFAEPRSPPVRARFWGKPGAIRAIPATSTPNILTCDPDTARVLAALLSERAPGAPREPVQPSTTGDD